MDGARGLGRIIRATHRTDGRREGRPGGRDLVRPRGRDATDRHDRWGHRPAHLAEHARADDRVGILLRRGGIHRSEADEIRAAALGVAGLGRVVRREPDRQIRSEQASSLLDGQVVLAQMDAVGAEREGELGVIVHATERQRYYEALKNSLPTLVQMMTESINNGLASVEKRLDEHESRVRGFTA